MTVSEAAAAASAACRAIGLDGAQAELIRVGHNAIYRLSDPPVVVRVARGSDEWGRVNQEVCIARWLADVGVPAVRLWDGVEQPIEAHERPVTVWEALARGDDVSIMGDLGGLLAALHCTKALPPCDLPQFDPLEKAEAQATSAQGVPPGLVATMVAECDRLREAYDLLEFVLPVGVIHGDAYRGNILYRNGEPVLIDFEGFAIGPQEWDLVPTAVARRRLGLPAHEWRAFVDAYGFDVESSPAFPVLSSIRETMATCWLMQLAADNTDALREVEVRVQSIREGDLGRAWRAF